jgi:DNA invertase Pin-like site-specific DNA recombinase
MKVIAYLRVSTDKQAEQGNGLDDQEAKIRAWAKAHGYKITGWFRDEGISGSNGIDSREALPEALAVIRDGKAQGIVVKCLDRLARDLVIQETLLAEIRRLGAELFTTSAAEQDYLKDDADDPSRKLIRQILGAVNEYERSMIKLRLKSGRKIKAAKGGYAYGSPAFGQRAEGRELVEFWDEMHTITRIREMRESGLSLAKIADALNEQGIAPKRGPMWYAQTVSRVLSR